MIILYLVCVKYRKLNIINDLSIFTRFSNNHAHLVMVKYYSFPRDSVEGLRIYTQVSVGVDSTVDNGGGSINRP